MATNATPGTPGEYATAVRHRLYSAFNMVADNIAMAGAKQKHYYDRHMRHNAYEAGDLVWVNLPALARQKLSPRWTGSFKVLQRLDSGEIGVDYNLQDQLDPRAKPKVVHYNHLKPYRSPWTCNLAPTTPENIQAESNQGVGSQLMTLSASRPYVYRSCELGANEPASPTMVNAPDPVANTPAIEAHTPQERRTRLGRIVRPPHRFRDDT